MGPCQGRRRELDVAWLVGCEREEGGRGGMRGGREEGEQDEWKEGGRERRMGKKRKEIFKGRK